MSELLMKLVSYHTARFATWETYAEYALIYGWIGAASALAALASLIFVVFRREAGRPTAIALAQYFLLWGLPIYAPTLLSLATKSATTIGGG